VEISWDYPLKTRTSKPIGEILEYKIHPFTYLEVNKASVGGEETGTFVFRSFFFRVLFQLFVWRHRSGAARRHACSPVATSPVVVSIGSPITHNLSPVAYSCSRTTCLPLLHSGYT
jgi:hypothetical protein